MTAEPPVKPADKPLSKPRWITLMTVVLSMFAVAAAGFVYIGHVDRQRAAEEKRARAQAAALEREADRRWCRLLTTMDDAYKTGTPTTDIGRAVASAIHEIRVDLGC